MVRRNSTMRQARRGVAMPAATALAPTTLAPTTLALMILALMILALAILAPRAADAQGVAPANPAGKVTPQGGVSINDFLPPPPHVGAPKSLATNATRGLGGPSPLTPPRPLSTTTAQTGAQQTGTSQTGASQTGAHISAPKPLTRSLTGDQNTTPPQP